MYCVRERKRKSYVLIELYSVFPLAQGSGNRTIHEHFFVSALSIFSSSYFLYLNSFYLYIHEIGGIVIPFEKMGRSRHKEVKAMVTPLVNRETKL